MLNYIWLIPTLPLAGSALIGLLGLISLRKTGEKLNKRIVSAIALGSVGLAFVLSVVVVYQLFAIEHKEQFSIDLFTWLRGGALPLAGGGVAHFEVPWGFLLDPLSAVMAQFERDYIERTLQLAGGERGKAAEMLGISRKNLWEKVVKHKLR